MKSYKGDEAEGNHLQFTNFDLGQTLESNGNHDTHDNHDTHEHGGKLKNLKEFHIPQNLRQAVKLLSRNKPNTQIIAGGTTIVRLKSPQIEALVDITHLGLNYIKLENKFLRIGATTTIAELLESDIIKNFASDVLYQSALYTASTPLRNVITVGGNISAGRIWSDLPPVLLVLDSKFTIKKGRKTRTIKAVDFFKKPASSNFKKGEILTEVIIPKLQDSFKGKFIKFSQTSFDYALFNLAVLASFSKDKCREVRIALGSAVNPPQRLDKLEKLLRGKKVADKSIEKIITKEINDLKFVKSFRVSEEYLKEVICVTIRRTLVNIVNCEL